MAGFVAKAQELGFTHIEANTSISPRMLSELLKTAVPVSSIHSPCPAVLSSQGIPISSLSLSSLVENKRTEAVSFTKKTIDLAANVKARAIVLHMGEVPIDLSLQDRLYKLCDRGFTQTKEYAEIRQQLVHQRTSRAAHYLDAARKSLHELSKYSRQKGIILGLETRFHPNEIPNINEMAELLNGVPEGVVGYWHDVGHAEVQQQLGFSLHEEWLSRFQDRMVGIHLHDIHGISDHHAPGKGNMDWEMIARYLPPGIVKVCEIGEWNDEEQMRGVVKFLQKKGIIS
ncbi:MAG: sugar phosphate isomerase/epimerase [Chloroflexi bacterium]|nr:sugar phosphate isomerase/epimerase [Chloroflexota bacterium]